jgi:hypothetical protein
MTAAAIKFKIGLMYNKIPIVEELIPFNANKLSHSGSIVNTTDNIKT